MVIISTESTKTQREQRDQITIEVEIKTNKWPEVRTQGQNAVADG